MKIYTKTGDMGQTSLVGGKRVSKADLRLDTYGTADELNSFVGLLRAQVGGLGVEPCGELDRELHTIQNKLFNLGAYLATEPEGKQVHCDTLLTVADVQTVEATIDRMDAALPPMRGFILPAGSECVAVAHVCRTVARRLERRMVELFGEDMDVAHRHQDMICLQYVNRLSDLFFVMARWIGELEHCTIFLWGK